MKVYSIGIDPGGEGAIVVLHSSQRNVINYVGHFMLSNFRTCDLKAIEKFLWDYNPSNSACVIETPFAFHRGKGSGLVTQGMNYGFIYTALKANGFIPNEVGASTWQSAFCTRGKNNDNVLAKLMENIVDWKEHFPRHKRVPEGFLDAFAIAYYGVLNFLDSKK